MMEISKNTFKRGIESDISFTKISRNVSQYIYDLEAFGSHKAKAYLRISEMFH